MCLHELIKCNYVDFSTSSFHTFTYQLPNYCEKLEKKQMPLWILLHVCHNLKRTISFSFCEYESKFSFSKDLWQLETFFSTNTEHFQAGQQTSGSMCSEYLVYACLTLNLQACISFWSNTSKISRQHSYQMIDWAYTWTNNLCVIHPLNYSVISMWYVNCQSSY